MATTTRLVLDGKLGKHWGATLDGKRLTLRWGRLGEGGQERARSYGSAEAAKAELDALVAAKKLGGYVEAEPPAGHLVFLADRHEHADVVCLSDDGRIVCSVCRCDVPGTVVGPAPPPPKKGRAIDAPALQARILWPLAAKAGEGKRIPSAKLIALAAQAIKRDRTLGTVAKAVEASRSRAQRMSLTPSRAPITRPVDKLGGDPAWLGAEQWPTCLRCSKPMMFLLQLRTGPRTGLPTLRRGMIYVFQCQSDPGMCDDWSATGGANAVVLQPNRERPSPLDAAKKRRRAQYEKAKRAAEKSWGTAPPDLWCTNMDAEFAIGLSAVDELRRPQAGAFTTPSALVAARVIYSAEEGLGPSGRRFYSKVGGHPAWVQDDETPKCTKCKKAMTFVAQLDSVNHPRADRELAFGDSGSSYLFVCEPDRQGKWLWQCF